MANLLLSNNNADNNQIIIPCQYQKFMCKNIKKQQQTKLFYDKSDFVGCMFLISCQHKFYW